MDGLDEDIGRRYLVYGFGNEVAARVKNFNSTYIDQFLQHLIQKG